MDKYKKVLISIIQMLLVAVLTICLFRFVVIPIRVEGSSMENNFIDQDIALVNRIGVSEKNIERFDVVVAYSKELDEMIIKRVIGLPYDSIVMKDDVLYINDELYEQDFLDDEFVYESKKRYNKKQFSEDFEIELGEDEYFLMGDNRLVSLDSRSLGPFSIHDIIGSKGIVIFPFNRIKWFV